ncbi:iron ABC transporter permease [Paenibacillus sp. N1-5-1-14]|uniref:FecCD family ABC transporter permease n=1 Tax=Paenibacillus radicibacter TaxID=2972488 RepID=UPI0021596828|nr:iron ABC transporter permease [Paenibacillus radicibacter]MCR8642832.1 iron ABC transporter permease [Paenibacillus radicibacter]
MVKEKPTTISFFIKLIAGLALLVIMFTGAMIFGAANTSVQDVWQAITAQAGGENYSIIREIRLPRELAAILVGSALAVSGAIIQGMTRNPLADPGLLGLTAGSSAALALTMAFLPKANYMIIMIACFIGAAVGALLVFGIGALKRGGFTPIRLVFAGAAVSAFLVAVSEGVSLAYKISQSVSLWTSGGLIGTTWDQLQLIFWFIAAGLIIAMLLARQLTILSLSEEVAVGLGQKTTLIKAILFLVTILLTGASVALVGNMTFIGLMIPHMVRAIVGTDYRYVVPMSAITGASFMLLADTIGRTLNMPYETPVIAIVAMIGLPFFLFIVHKGGRSFL